MKFVIGDCNNTNHEDDYNQGNGQQSNNHNNMNCNVEVNSGAKR